MTSNNRRDRHWLRTIIHIGVQPKHGHDSHAECWDEYEDMDAAKIELKPK